jgi:hypothetical protein
MNNAKSVNVIHFVSDEEALVKANALTADEQNYRFSVKARDEQIYASSKVPRIRLVGGHAVVCNEPQETVPADVSVEPVLEVCVAESVLAGGARVRAGRGLYGLNKKRRENYRS